MFLILQIAPDQNQAVLPSTKKDLTEYLQGVPELEVP